MYARINPFTALMEVAGLETVFASDAPTPLDASFSVPTLWIDETQDAAWMLLRVSGGVGYWALIASCDAYPLGLESGDTLITESGETIIYQ